jgi:hypothetical protein
VRVESLNESGEEVLNEDESRGAKSVGVEGSSQNGRAGGEGSERESECRGRSKSVRCQLEEEIRACLCGIVGASAWSESWNSSGQLVGKSP